MTNEELMIMITKEKFKPGTRIVLISMGNDPRPLPSGTRGTVRCVDDMGTVHTDWDNGRSLGVIPNEDVFITETEYDNNK